MNTDPETDDLTLEQGESGNESPIKSVLHYAQNIVQDRFQEYTGDYNRWFNDENKQTSEFDLKSIKDIPVAIFAGLSDPLANTIDAKWIRDELGANCIKYQEIAGGHETFQIGKDMDYFSKDVMQLLVNYSNDFFLQ